MTYYPTVRDVERIIKRPGFHGENSSVMNRGQLEFALDKPKISLRGREQYPLLHQKAAVLAESICKAHTLSDGNKRAALAVAEFMVAVNGGYLVIPLKAVGLMADIAMDKDDLMSGEVRAWFKAHVASSPAQLRGMLQEIAEEKRVLAGLPGKEAEKAASEWLALERHPECRRQWLEGFGAKRAG